MKVSKLLRTFLFKKKTNENNDNLFHSVSIQDIVFKDKIIFIEYCKN